jgi:hypothetical protein
MKTTAMKACSPGCSALEPQRASRIHSQGSTSGGGLSKKLRAVFCRFPDSSHPFSGTNSTLQSQESHKGIARV